MKWIIKITIIACIACYTQNLLCQNKKYKRNKGTSKREIRKRQQKAFEKEKDMNAFNPLQPMGIRENDARDDLLWHHESANTVYPGAGNISLISPSRYGLKQGLELSTNLLINYWVPNLTLKKRWANQQWYIASKHGLYSASSGIKWAQKNNHSSIIDSTTKVPLVISIKNELIISRYIASNNTCSKEQPYIILTAGIGVDFGIRGSKTELAEMKEHFLSNRSPALTGNGALGYAKIRADWQINSMMTLGGGLKYFRGDFTGNHAFEQATKLQTFIISGLSVNVGYILSIAQYNTPNSFGIFPLIDINLYFGKRQSRQKGLWGSKMF